MRMQHAHAGCLLFVRACPAAAVPLYGCIPSCTLAALLYVPVAITLLAEGAVSLVHSAYHSGVRCTGCLCAPWPVLPGRCWLLGARTCTVRSSQYRRLDGTTLCPCCSLVPFCTLHWFSLCSLAECSRAHVLAALLYHSVRCTGSLCAPWPVGPGLTYLYAAFVAVS